MRYAIPLALITLVGSSIALADNQRDCALHVDSAVRITSCSQTIQDHPRNAGAYLHRASAFYASGDLERALADFSTAIELNPNDPAAYDKRGVVYAAKGDYARALADVLRASELAKAQKADAVPQPVPARAHARKPATSVKARARLTDEPAFTEAPASSIQSLN